MRFLNGFGLFALAVALGLAGGGFVPAAFAMPVDRGMGLPEAVTPVMHDLVALHNWLLITISI
ncbi:MAG: cytochrome c oxidase subunit II, partial [Parvibaculum sp.]|nr:cytochrome c oxidase subunit II [Parvibaculum sp.]